MAGWIFFLFFAVIEFSIAMYDQGTLIHGSRLGAREASLYWLDVTQMGPDTDPLDDQRIMPSHVEKVLKTDFVDRFVVSFSGQETSVDIRHEGARINDLDTRVVGPGDRVSVDLSFAHGAPVTAALAHLIDLGLNLGARAEMRVE